MRQNALIRSLTFLLVSLCSFPLGAQSPCSFNFYDKSGEVEEWETSNSGIIGRSETEGTFLVLEKLNDFDPEECSFHTSAQWCGGSEQPSDFIDFQIPAVKVQYPFHEFKRLLPQWRTATLLLAPSDFERLEVGSSYRAEDYSQRFVSYPGSGIPAKDCLSYKAIVETEDISDLIDPNAEEFVSPWCKIKRNCGTFTDNEREYRWTKLGDQVWMAENFKDGYTLNSIMDYRQGRDSRYCYYDQDANCERYGGLYQWNTVMGFNQEELKSAAIQTPHHRGICPEGWHVPNNAEWRKLIEWLNRNNDESKNGSVANALKSIWGWENDLDGSDAFGFEALPAGIKGDWTEFAGLGESTSWWSAERDEVGRPYWIGLYSPFDSLKWRLDQTGLRNNSLRCVKDSPSSIEHSSQPQSDIWKLTSVGSHSWQLDVPGLRSWELFAIDGSLRRSGGSDGAVDLSAQQRGIYILRATGEPLRQQSWKLIRE